MIDWSLWSFELMKYYDGLFFEGFFDLLKYYD